MKLPLLMQKGSFYRCLSPHLQQGRCESISCILVQCQHSLHANHWPTKHRANFCWQKPSHPLSMSSGPVYYLGPTSIPLALNHGKTWCFLHLRNNLMVICLSIKMYKFLALFINTMYGKNLCKLSTAIILLFPNAMKYLNSSCYLSVMDLIIQNHI